MNTKIKEKSNAKNRLCLYCKGVVNPKATKCHDCHVKIKRDLGLGRLALVVIAISILASMISASFSNVPSRAESASPVPMVVAAAFDVPSLIGKDIEGAIKMLGIANLDNSEPTALQLQFGVREWSKSWEKNGQVLLLTYAPEEGIIIDFFLPTIDPSGVTLDITPLLKAGNLEKSNPIYAVDFVKAIKSAGYTGVKVTPR
jgi:hypothetical protein